MPSKKRSAGEPAYDFTAQRLYIDAELADGVRYDCDASQGNYLTNVLRKRTGDSVYVFNGKDGEWSAQIDNPKKTKCTLIIQEKVREQQPPQDIEYLFAPLKRARLDYMVQKATELGASALRPVITRRTIVDRINDSRMHANVIEAAEQCGVLNIPEILPAVKFDALIDSWDDKRVLIHCDEAAEVQSPIEALSALPSSPLAVLIGPEGGFDNHERDRLNNLPQSVSISLGPRIMRADTAAVAALSLVNAVLGDWNHS